MGVYLPGMEMPKSCSTEACFVRTVSYEDGAVWCPVAKGYLGDEATVCPLVPVPPHGRLIDESEIPWCVDWYAGRKRYYTTPKTIEHLPTIIPAEEGEE